MSSSLFGDRLQIESADESSSDNGFIFIGEMHAEVISRPPFFNFSDVSDIDQLMRTFEVHARFITARIGVHR